MVQEVSTLTVYLIRRWQVEEDGRSHILSHKSSILLLIIIIIFEF